MTRELDSALIGAALLVALLGVIMIYSAGPQDDPAAYGGGDGPWRKQAIYGVVAVVLTMVVVFLPYKLLHSLAYVLYAVSLLSLIAVLLWGTGEQASRWLEVGPVRLQPAEFAKLAVIIALARYLGDLRAEEVSGPRAFCGAFLIAAVPLVLVARQPDLGTGMAFGAALFPMLYWAGMRRAYIFCIISPMFSVIFSLEELWQGVAPFVFAVFVVVSSIAIHFLLGRLWATATMVVVNLSAGLITAYLWKNLLHDYQKERILTFLDPESDRLRAGWNIIQSKIAIGSGGVTGKGLLKGTQTRFEFLPAAHTDFIFSVIGEELGFVGAMAVLALFSFLVSRALQIGYLAQSRFYSLLAIGLAALLAFHVFVNIGMAIGLMPVTGLPLPFLSYGGSSLLASFLGIGLLLHVYAYRHEY